MTILISGASTQLGRSLTERLVGEGRPVRLLTRRPFSGIAAFSGPERCLEWHPLSEPLPEAALDGVSSIVHLMGEPFEGRLTPPKVERLALLRRTAADKIIAGLSRRSARVILASSAAIYTDAAGEAYTEASAVGEPRTILQIAAHAWEGAAGAARAAGAQVAIARFGLVVGADRVLEDLARWISAGVSPKAASATVPLIDREDAVALLVGLIDNPDIDGPINAVAPVQVSTAELCKRLSDSMGVRQRIALPARLTARALGAGAELLLRRSQIVPRRLMELGCSFSQPDPLANLPRVIDAAWERRMADPSSLDYLRAAFHGFARPLKESRG
jgi:NAD dependent epimerase/dehydratase family enzyme